MDGTRTATVLMSRSQEREILTRIVQAMVAAEDELRQADEHEWSSVLKAACRRQKRAKKSRRELVGSSC